MDWTMPVNELFKEDITKINHKLMPPYFKGDARAVKIMQLSLSKLIDLLGKKSAAAQGLNKVITTAEKLSKSETNVLYLLKDPKAKGGDGDLIGLLKVGRKHLYLYDEHGDVHEVEPVCILDFFVVNTHQRAGYGKILFDHMLKDLKVSPKELAIDGPSGKMEQFLMKNYGINTLVKQSNNFAVAPEFFQLVPLSKSGRSTPVETPTYGRFGAPKPPSSIATVIHGVEGAYSDETGWNDSESGDDLDRGEDRAQRYKMAHSASPECLVDPEPESKTDAKPEPKPEPVIPPNIVNRNSLERPCTLSVEPVGEVVAVATPCSSAPELSPAGSRLSRRPSQLTNQGYFDVKYYHNKLW